MFFVIMYQTNQAGCDACWLYENGVCEKETLYEKMKAESEDKYEMS